MNLGQVGGGVSQSSRGQAKGLVAKGTEPSLKAPLKAALQGSIDRQSARFFKIPQEFTACGQQCHNFPLWCMDVVIQGMRGQSYPLGMVTSAP